MVPVEVGRELADIEVAKALGISAGEEVVRRSRHATIDGSAVQLHTAYYPARLAEGTPLAGAGKITGGVYGAMRAADMRPTSADEKVGTRPASAEEAAELALSPGAFVLTVDRVTHDDAGQALEFLRMVIDPARTELVYDGLPLAR
jgi:GntR family transcriptional regulator